MIYVTFRGRLGNQMFQYTLARILGEKFNQRIHTSSPDFPFIEENEIIKRTYEKNILVDDNNFLQILESKNLDSTNFILSGYFQNRLFPLKYGKKILDCFNIEQRHKEREEIFIHYRLGDFPEDNIPRPEYYIYCLDEILKTSNQKIYISTDSPQHDRIIDLQKKYEAKIVNFKKPREAIIYGSQFKNKILSFGTFSWWIGFLGNQNNIYCPNPKDHRGDGSDIFPLEGWKSISKKEYLKIK
jgi:hypothetical protein